MSNAYSNNQFPGEPGLPSGTTDIGCQANDLKGLLNAIVSQISEADRRHSDSLQQMQDRLSNLGRDARSMRSRVPDQFQTAFERIEAGMAELAARIAEAQNLHPGSNAFSAAGDLSQSRGPAFADDAVEPYFAHQSAPAFAPQSGPATFASEPVQLSLIHI